MNQDLAADRGSLPASGVRPQALSPSSHSVQLRVLKHLRFKTQIHMAEAQRAKPLFDVLCIDVDSQLCCPVHKPQGLSGKRGFTRVAISCRFGDPHILSYMRVIGIARGVDEAVEEEESNFLR